MCIYTSVYHNILVMYTERIIKYRIYINANIVCIYSTYIIPQRSTHVYIYTQTVYTYHARERSRQHWRPPVSVREKDPPTSRTPTQWTILDTIFHTHVYIHIHVHVHIQCMLVKLCSKLKKITVTDVYYMIFSTKYTIIIVIQVHCIYTCTM